MFIKFSEVLGFLLSPEKGDYVPADSFLSIRIRCIYIYLRSGGKGIIPTFQTSIL